MLQLERGFVVIKEPKYLRRLKGDEVDEHDKIKRECLGSQVFFNMEFVILHDFFNFVFLKFTLPSTQEPDTTIGNETSSDTTEEYVNKLLKVIPFGRPNSSEVLPIIAGLILNSCLNGLNTKLNKNNAELTKFVKSPSSINRLWKRPLSNRSYH
ncbi:unnamed protein product [Ambrosiozyma monospora]|uniref:Unnamed protein product n=1 Tax=Ambrosiozyma monospora TaxID=43982 RepID=A0ACB5TL27_AMBMO|nr:unnamed protein product [Ambrosiozyma monospora]